MAPSKIDTPTYTTAVSSEKLQSFAKQGLETKFSDFRDDFFRDGYAVIKNAVPKDRTTAYRDASLDWLESFDIGFDRNDKSTWQKENLPQSFKGGMYLHFAASHEKWMWDARCEPKVIDAFARLWQTDELLVSFDSPNITLPSSIVGEYDSKPWPHCDQAPEKRGLNCVQGIINLSDSGPTDGGLVVLRGSAPLFDQFFAENPVSGPMPWRTAKHQDFHPFSDANVAWFKAHGCETVKICAEAGDLIIWDSRQVHWAEFAKSERIRSLVYATYVPAAWMDDENRALKKELFTKYQTTTHWPHVNLYTHGGATLKNAEGVEVPDPLDREKPLTQRVESEKMLKLAGVVPY